MAEISSSDPLPTGTGFSEALSGRSRARLAAGRTLLCGATLLASGWMVGRAIAASPAPPPPPAASTKPVSAKPAVDPALVAAQRQFAARVRQGLDRTLGVKVVYQDVLGEGAGAWDSDPRYPTDKVNCITWLQMVLAETYGNTPQEKLQILDRIRYFDGHVAFGLRKHYTDQWTALDPLPLRRIPYDRCDSSGLVHYHVDLDPARFRKSIGYGCPLYHMDRKAIDLDVISGPGMVQCSRGLPEGYYVFFPVASDHYLEKYGGFSGAMGEVHAVLMEVPPHVPGETPETRDPADYKVYHASISSGRVVETKLASYILHMWSLYRGYVLYEIVPDWDWKTTVPWDDEAKAIAACEKELKGTVGKLYEHEVEGSPSPRRLPGGSPP